MTAVIVDSLGCQKHDRTVLCCCKLNNLKLRDGSTVEPVRAFYVLDDSEWNQLLLTRILPAGLFGTVSCAPSVVTCVWVTYILWGVLGGSVCLKIMREYWSCNNISYISKYSIHVKFLFTGLETNNLSLIKAEVRRAAQINFLDLV
jgi:hypothetical protein